MKSKTTGPMESNASSTNDVRPIMNTYEQLRVAVSAGVIPQSQAVAICYSPSRGRSPIPSRAKIYSPFFKTHPEPHKCFWADYGDQTFSGNRSDSVPKAIAWASERFGITDWKGNRMGDKVPAIVQKRFPIPKVP